MKFFVPFADGPTDGERFWATMRARMANEYGLPTTRRRIFALETDCGAVEVGDGTPSNDYEDVVMAILECEPLDNMYFVITHIHDELEDPPYPLSLNEKWRVVDFEWGWDGAEGPVLSLVEESALPSRHVGGHPPIRCGSTRGGG